jgi:hypothetical protein
MLLFPLCIQAQVGYPAKQAVTGALKDADYAFRRFEEVTPRVDFDRWNLEDSLRAQSRERLRLLSGVVKDARKTVSRIESSDASVSGLDLLYVYQILVRSESELDELSTNTLNFQQPASPDIVSAAKASELALDLQRASATVLNSETRLLPVLTSQIAAAEHELARCRTKPR